jgi:hypothetical protein
MSSWSRFRPPWSVIVTAAACVALLVVLAILWDFAPVTNSSRVPTEPPPPKITTVWVSDVDFSPNYDTNNTSSSNIDYLATPNCYPVSNPSAGCPPGEGDIVTPECPGVPYLCVNATPGAAFPYDLALIDTANTSRTIQSIHIVAPFVLEGVTPALPYAMPPGLPATTFQIEILAPSTPGYYDMNGIVNCW